MAAALFFIIPTGAALALASIITDYFNFWGWN